MAPRTPCLLLALAACVPAGRGEVELPVVLSATEPGPFVFDDVVVRLERATLSTADLLVVDDAGRPQAAWAGQRPANLLGLPGPHGTMRLYDGTGVRSRFVLEGDPTMILEGRVEQDTAIRPFTAEVTGRREVEQVASWIPVATDAPPSQVNWTVDLARVLAEVDWSEDGLDDDAAFDDAVLDGLADPAAWRLDAAD